MKLSEIEGIKLVSVWADGLPYALEPVDKLHTPDQMQEYAKAQVAEALKACLQINIPGRCDGKSAMIAEQFKNTIDSIFEEDTKND